MIDFDWIWYFFENCCFLSLFYFISLLNRGMVVLALSQRKWFKPIVPHLLLIFRLTPKFFALCFFNMFGWHVSIVSFVGHWLNIPAHHSHVEYLSEIYVDVCIIMLYLISADKKQKDLEPPPPPPKKKNYCSSDCYCGICRFWDVVHHQWTRPWLLTSRHLDILQKCCSSSNHFHKVVQLFGLIFVTPIRST